MGSLVARAYDTSWIGTGQLVTAAKLKADLDEAQARVAALENAATSEIWVSDPPTSGGTSPFGTSSTMIFHFTNVIRSAGSAITRNSTAADGDAFTINQPGVYSLYMTSPEAATTGIAIGFSLNAVGSDLTTSILDIDRAKRVGSTYAPSAPTRAYPSVSVTLRLAAGDVVRPHGDGSWVEAGAVGASAPLTTFHITKVSN